MSIIYPPHIASTIPAFVKDTSIKIPFTNNSVVVGWSGLFLVVHDLQNNKIATSQYTGGIETISQNPETGMYEVTFTTLTLEKDQTFNPGQYYKMQIAYIDSEDIDTKNNKLKESFDPYFSSASIGRCILSIEVGVTVSGLIATGTVTPNPALKSEVPYQYRFRLGDKDNSVENLTEWENFKEEDFDEAGKATVTYTINDHSLFNKQLYVWFETKTINGYEISGSAELGELNYDDSPMQGNITISPIVNYDEGYTELSISGITEGTYENIDVVRALEGSDTWETIYSFSGVGKISCLDKTTESGLSYKYGLIGKKSDGTYDYYFQDSVIIPYFEDTFLIDGDRQLKIRFNPKVSSFKETLIESKQDTIGGKYPFFFRNGDVRYKEIPISGLISYQMDDNQNFMSDRELGLDSDVGLRRGATGANNYAALKTRTTSLADYNIATERKFKIAVLEWLNNGKPKLFKSPAEGNYIVRLMNVSLTPEDKLGRMIHSFSATGYECMDINEENLRELGITKTNTTVNGTTTAATFDLRTRLIPDPIYFQDFGTVYSLSFSGDGEVQISYNKPYKGMLVKTFNPIEETFVFDTKMSIKDIRTTPSITTNLVSSRTPKVVATGPILDDNFYLDSSTLLGEDEEV